MCLGASARTANENARRRYAYENERRERNWMQNLSIYNAQKVKYEEDAVNASLAQAAATTQQQQEMDIARGNAQLKYAELFRKHIEESSYSKLAASGVTGRSAERRKALDYAKTGRDMTKVARQLILNERELSQKTAADISKYQAFKDSAFAKVAFQPQQDVAPPQPVMQSVGAAAFMDALSIASSIATAGGAGGFGLWGVK